MTALLALLLKKDSPAIAFLLTLAAGVLLFNRATIQAGGALEQVRQIFVQSGMDGTLYFPVVKTVVVAVTVRVISALCKDAGQSALAVQVELIGALAALAMCLPLLEQVLQLISGWIA